ncbi:MAG: putative major facilitator superfamily transporter [Pseudonocardiales bacterium]|nr:putative major facilitator superfamily transporter [Pseudonocardiales bacterium]
MTRSDRIEHAPRPKGWTVVAAAFAILGISSGITFYSMSAFINGLVDQRGFSLAVASAGPTMSSAFGAVGGLFTAWLMKRMTVRSIVLIGAAGLGTSLMLIGASHTIWQLWGAFALSGWFGSMASGIPVTALVARWFPIAPAKPLVLAQTGMSVGGALLPPVVLSAVNGWGLTAGGLLLGGMLFAVLGLAALYMREPPAGLTARKSAGDGVHTSVLSALFLTLMGGMLCLFVSQIATIFHIVRLAEENGTGGTGAAASVLALGAFVSRLGGIPLLPVIGLRTMTVSVALIQAAAQFVLAGAYSEAQLFVGMFLLGVAMGNVSVLSSLFIIEAYGLSDFPRLMARMGLAWPIGSGVGPLLVGLLHGMSGGYPVPLMAMGTLSLIGGVTLFSTGIDSDSTMRDRRRIEAPVPQ